AVFGPLVLRAMAGELVEAGGKVVPVEVLRARLAGWEAKRTALEARIVADGARIEGVGDVDMLGREALAAERAAAVLQARAKVLEDRYGGDATKVKAAEGALAKAEQVVGKDGGSYQMLRGSKKALEGPDRKDEDDPRVYSEVSSGRRLAFAKWVVSRDNPLAARVAVNHVWARHFGEPLVESVFDFGRRAERPEHLALLDYLAVELMESGWSLKRLHRLMVTSGTYRRGSSNHGADEATLAADPGNRFYWRMNPRRMESQVVRDSLLVLAGELDETMGGPALDVGAGTKRRSLYFKHSRDQREKFLSMFDDADFLACYRRQESVVPQQALALANSKLALEMAEKIAGRVSGGEIGDFLREGFRLVLGREAGEDEVEACLEFCEEVGGDEKRVRVLLVHSLLNHNDFVTVR
ncbi:MAG: DUF1553 domain-containing protein, partial [Verrucomicrobiales bacterium]|nr:DUF1553 domain-containing protein [Verrucomicrobiales bacterium]